MARQRQQAQPSVERKIIFYRADVGDDDNGHPIPFDPTPVLRHIETLAFDTNGRYIRAADGNFTLCLVDENRTPHRLRLATSRRSGLPQIEDAGNLRRLGIPAHTGLAESIHVVFFRDNIVGADFNFYGPRVSRLSTYFAVRADSVCPPITFQPLLRQDILTQINRLRDVRLLQLRIRPAYANIVTQANRDLGSAFEAAARVGEAEEVEITLRPRPHSRARLDQRVLTAIRALARRDDLRGNVSGFHVKGFDPETERVELVDVLSDKLISTKRMVLEGARTRAIQADSAYAAIREAHQELHDELVQAAGVQA